MTEIIPTRPAFPQLPILLDDFTVALRLGIQCKTLWWILKTKQNRYKVFTIPKSDGSKRFLHNPCNTLKFVQRRILQLILQPIPVLPCVGAYVEGKRCVDSAKEHVNKQIRIGLDLKNFFPSHSRAMVRWFFHKHVGYSYYASSLLADLCTAKEGTRNFVPQGSPCSPTLCNLIAQERLDRRLLKYLTPRGWAYTRYSDDLSLSHADKKSPEAVNKVIADVTDIISRAGYVVNRKKKKIQRAHHRQKMLGVVVNKKISIPRQDYRYYRAVLTNCIHAGFEYNALRYNMDVGAFPAHLRGKISYYLSIDPVKGQRLLDLYEIARDQNISHP